VAALVCVDGRDWEMCGICLCVCACCVYIVLIMPCEATSHRMLQLPYVQVCYRPPLYTIKHAPACNMAAVLASEQLTALFVSNVSCPAAGHVCMLPFLQAHVKSELSDMCAVFMATGQTRAGSPRLGCCFVLYDWDHR
jgi:hypothetical protein